MIAAAPIRSVFPCGDGVALLPVKSRCVARSSTACKSRSVHVCATSQPESTPAARNIERRTLLASASTLCALLSGSTDEAKAFSNPFKKQEAVTELAYYEVEITGSSSPKWIKLAKHLNKTGAKMYGAFWCAHCRDQKNAFGKEAVQYLPYVECNPDGYKKGEPLAQECIAADVNGYPTWLVNGQRFEGEQTFETLAKASGFRMDVEYGPPSS